MKRLVIIIAVIALFSPFLSSADDSATPIAPRVAPRGPGQQITWLADRAQISELILSFGRSLDSRDAEQYAANFADGGYVQIPEPPTLEYRTVYKPELAAFAQTGLFDIYRATQHRMSNIQISITGNRTANARCNLAAVHVIGTDTNPFAPHWDAGGYYDWTFVKTRQGIWKIFSAKLTVVWVGPSVE